MEQSIWREFTDFVRESYQERFIATFGGILIGFHHAGGMLFIGSNFHVARWIIATLVIIKGFAIAAITSLVTSYMAYLFNKHIKKYLDGKNNQKKRKSQGRKAA